jgi:hypothetical protein
MSSGLIFQIQSTLIVGLFVFGFINRKNRRIHIRSMGIAIIWDILLVLQIELTRGAVNKALKVDVNPSLLNFHVSIAVLTVFLYIFMGRTGYLLKKGIIRPKRSHKVIGCLTILCRLSTYITSFFIVK